MNMTRKDVFESIDFTSQPHGWHHNVDHEDIAFYEDSSHCAHCAEVINGLNEIAESLSLDGTEVKSDFINWKILPIGTLV